MWIMVAFWGTFIVAGITTAVWQYYEGVEDSWYYWSSTLFTGMLIVGFLSLAACNAGG